MFPDYPAGINDPQPVITTTSTNDFGNGTTKAKDRHNIKWSHSAVAIVAVSVFCNITLFGFLLVCCIRQRRMGHNSKKREEVVVYQNVPGKKISTSETTEEPA